MISLKTHRLLKEHVIGKILMQKRMKKSDIIRFLILPFGLLLKLLTLSKEGSRDIFNLLRYKNVEIDTGCCINEKSKIEANTHILKNCYINNCQIGSFTYVGRNSIVQNARIGKFCSIANDVFIGLGNHPIDLISTSPLFYRKRNTLKIELVDEDYEFDEYDPITIGNDVWIGSRAIILDGVNIGNGAIIASNSVITKDVAPYAIVAGVPARVIKFRFTEEKIEELQKLEWWQMSLAEIKEKFVVTKKNGYDNI